MTTQITQNIIVGDSAHHVFEQWAHVENFPHFMKGVQSVRRTGEHMAQWQLKGEDGTAVSFTTETTRLEPDKRIAWNTPTGDVKTSGQITFTPLPHDETEITISLHVVPGDGDNGPVNSFLSDPNAQLMHTLRNFKAYVEDMPERIR